MRIGHGQKLGALALVVVVGLGGVGSGCALDAEPVEEPDEAGAGDADALGSEVRLVPDPCASFLPDRRERAAFATPLSDKVCAIDSAALDLADVRWTAATPVEVHEGSAFQFLANPNGDEAIVATYRVLAVDSGLLEICEAPGTQRFATAIASAALKCARSSACRGLVVRGAKALASGIVSGVASSAIWEGIKRLFD
jgi:hypothetical protein